MSMLFGFGGGSQEDCVDPNAKMPSIQELTIDEAILMAAHFAAKARIATTEVTIPQAAFQELKSSMGCVLQTSGENIVLMGPISKILVKEGKK